MSTGHAGVQTLIRPTMRSTIEDTIRGEYRNILPEARQLRDVYIKRDNFFGLHVVTSRRFVCTLKALGPSNEPLEIKIFVKNRGNVLEEAEHMQLLWREHYCQGNKYQIPEPLYVDKTHKLLFLRYWPGDGFLSLFYRSAMGGRQQSIPIAEDYAENAARWLVDFQQIYSLADKKEVPTELLDFSKQLTTMQGFSAAVRERIGDKMRGLQDTLPRLRDTYVHDQYLSRNILYKVGAICVIDFPHFRTGWPLYDFLTFYTGIERLKQYPFFSDATAELMKEVFAQTYLSSKGLCYDAEWLENLWAFFILGYVAKRYSNKDVGRVRGLVNNAFIKQMLRKLASWSKN